MKYVGNLTNAIRGALALVATNVAPSNAIYRTDIDRTGGGLVALAGAYTGQADATFEVEVLNNTLSGAPQMSAPTFAGVGNGEMTAVTGTISLSPQRIDVTLVDLGTETRHAYTPFQGVTLQAVTAGAGGNAITISVDEAGITRTETDFALLAEIRSGVNEYKGLEWDFGAVVLEPEGTIPASAPRIAFGADPQVYRQYKQFRDGAYVYSFSPSPVRDVPAGARIHTVAGSRTVTITDGSQVDTYAGVTTLYSLLDAIQGDPGALVEVVQPVTVDNRPGGMGVTEMSVLTASFVATFRGDGSQYAKDADIELVPAETAPTERLTIRCIDASVVGSEVWSVTGSVLGALDNAITGLTYDGEVYDFRIPHVESVGTTTSGLLSYSVEYAPRPDAAPDGCIQLFRPQLGRNARDKEISFTYTARPQPACDCDAESVEGGPNPDCLGQPPEGDDELSLQPLQQQRLERITLWVAGLSAENGWPHGASNLALAASQAGGIASQNLRRMLAGTTDYPVWVAATAYTLGTIRRPIAANGRRYRVSTAGTSHASTEPTWPTTTGNTVVDGTVTWTDIGKDPFGQFDDALTAMELDFEAYRAAGVGDLSHSKPWVATTAYTVGDVVAPTTLNGRRYIAIKGQNIAPTNVGTSAGSEPTWPTAAYGTVVDGDLTWMTLPPYWAATTAVAKGAIGYVLKGTVDGNSIGYRCTTAGTTGATEPAWPTTGAGVTITDGSVVWTATQLTPVGTSGLSAAYRSHLGNVFLAPLAAAGIDPSFEEAGIEGNQCWQDDTDATHWWVPSDPDYLPAFSNRYYHSTKRGFDTDGEEIAVSTQEFGFAIQCCDQIEGDVVVVKITGAGGGRVYQQGDTFIADVIRAAAVQLGGGQTGNDELTWRVVGTVDSGFDDHVLDRTSPNTYNDNGLSFLITPGGIPFELGDVFTVYAEGGQFRWRKDAGSWTTTNIGASVSLSDGVSATFTPGAAPSFVPGDTYGFVAEAIYGPAKLASLKDGTFKSTAATVITITPASPELADGIFLGDHNLPDGTTVQLEGSNDDFTTSPLNTSFQTAGRDSWHQFSQVGPYGKFRITIPAACEVGWAWVGVATEAALQDTGAREIGRLRKRIRLASLTRRPGLGVAVEHAALSQESVDELLELFQHAADDDASRIGIACNGIAEPTQVALVEIDGDTIELQDELDYGPIATSKRYVALNLTLNPIP